MLFRSEEPSGAVMSAFVEGGSTFRAGNPTRGPILAPSAMPVTNVAGDALCRAELRVCGTEAPERRRYTNLKIAVVDPRSRSTPGSKRRERRAPAARQFELFFAAASAASFSWSRAPASMFGTERFPSWHAISKNGP